MTYRKKVLWSLIFIAVTLSPALPEGAVLFWEDFSTLEHWKYVKQPLVKRETKYTIVKEGENSILKCEADRSASSLQSIYYFDVYQYPVVKWKWKTDRVLSNGDVTKKKGDDYPIRLYVNFSYNKETADAGFTFKYNFVKATYGLEIPQSSLNYIIESRKQEKQIYDNPFDPENSKIIILRSGKEAEGNWYEESINILEDYKKAFGVEPPREAYLAIMCDTDNTKEATTSYFDYIGVYQTE